MDFEWICSLFLSFVGCANDSLIESETSPRSGSALFIFPSRNGSNSKTVFWRRRSDLNRCIEVLQTSALPLGYAARKKKMERETGFEPATSTLARLHSTAELFPLSYSRL